jgi:hypothetical protein
MVNKINDKHEQIDNFTKSENIYLAAKTVCFEPQGLAQVQTDEMARAFGLPD